MAGKARRDWVRSVIGNGCRAAGRRATAARFPLHRRLHVEPLEDRWLLATVTVNSLVDEADGSIEDGDISLRDAIAATSAGDTIDFSVTGTINLTSLGHLTINNNLTINGPGANLLTINAFDPTPASNNGDGSRVFLIDDGNFMNLAGVVLAGFTLTGGDSSSSGGALFSREKLTVTASTITGNSANAGGGLVNFGGDLTVTESTISGNLARGTSDGGGIANAYGNLSVTRSTIFGNTGRLGGGIFLESGDLTVIDSTISGNAATRNGGGIFSNETTTIAGSTISGNSAGQSGGGVFNRNGLTVIRHSTITANEAIPGAGGGAASFGDAADTRTEVAGSIISGNVNSDVAFVYYTSGSNTFQSNGYNLIGTGDAVPAFTNNDQTGVTQPRLGPLAANGGPTLTHAVLVGSPALDRGDPAAVAGAGGVPEFDQRGDPYVRVFNGDGTGGARIDIGAFERQMIASLSLVVDTLNDENDGNYLTGDFSLREAIDVADSRLYSHDTITFAAPLTANGPATITLNDGDLGVTDSMTINGPGADLLTIDASGNDPTPGTNNGDGSRVFYIQSGVSSTIDVQLIGLALTGGDVPNSGGAIRSTENLAVIRSSIRGNWASSHGGGIYQQFGTLTVTACAISGNVTEQGGGIANSAGNLIVMDSLISNNSAANFGGGIFSETGLEPNLITTTMIVGSTISGNSAGTSGGGVYTAVAGMLITDCTISGNSADDGSGGGIFNKGHDSAAPRTIANSTISGNTAAASGGGLLHFDGLLTVRHSTITNNTALDTGGGSGVAARGGSNTTLEVQSSIIAGNTASDVDIISPSFSDPFLSLGYNLIGTGSGTAGFVEPGDQTGVANPVLGPLVDNGGPTRTHALLPGSPAIDTGDPSFDPADPDGDAETEDALPFDQRGAPFNRVFDGNSNGVARIDIGAYELQPDGTLGDYNRDGGVNAADYVMWRKLFDTSVAPPFVGADGDGDSTVDPGDYDVWEENFGETLPRSGGAGIDGETGRRGEGEMNSSRTVEQQSSSEGEQFRILDFPPRRVNYLRNGVSGELGVRSRSPAPIAAQLSGLRDRAIVAWLAGREVECGRGLEHVGEATLDGGRFKRCSESPGDDVDAVFGELFVTRARRGTGTICSADSARPS